MCGRSVFRKAFLFFISVFSCQILQIGNMSKTKLAKKKDYSQGYQTLENTKLYHLLLAPVSNCKIMKMHMLPAGPSVLAGVCLVSVWNGDTCQRNSCVAGRIVLAGHSLQNETNVLAFEAKKRYTILSVQYRSMVWFPHCGGQSYST